jgi:hypothetical protein
MIAASHIVMDKSYLQGCTISNLEEIISKHRIIVCAETFHEVVSSPGNEMKGCMEKLLAFTTSVDLLDHNGTLLNYEIENRKPCKPLSDHVLPIVLNPKWNYTISDPENVTITDFHKHWEVDGPKDFDEIVLEIIGACGRSTPEQVASDRETVLKAYDYLRSSEERLPMLDNLNEDWAIYRRLQVELIAAHEYMYSFQDGQFCIRKDRKGHNQIDFRVLIAACLAAGVATRDKLIRRYFNILCPVGTVYWLER